MTIARSSGLLAHVLLHSSVAFAKSNMAALLRSNHGLLPALSGNQPFVPPAPTVKIR